MKVSRAARMILLVSALVLLAGCGNVIASETVETTSTGPIPTPAAINNEYGILQDLVDTYGFPFEFRYTEGMELTNITVFEDHAKREWHTNSDFTTHDNLKWNLIDNTLEIRGDWTESFALDMERGTAASLTDGTEYRFVVHLPNSIDTQWYVSWDTDVGFTEIDGVRQ